MSFMETTYCALILASVGVNALVLTAGCRRLASSRRNNRAMPASIDPNEADIETDLRHAAQKALALACMPGVCIQIAAQRDLTLQANQSVVRALVMEAVTCALLDSSCAQIIITAARQAGRLRLAVTDDGLTTTKAMLEARLRRASETVAMRGGSMHIEVRPGAGTTVAFHLPLPLAPVFSHEDRADAPDTPEQPVIWPQPVQVGHF